MNLIADSARGRISGLEDMSEKMHKKWKGKKHRGFIE